MIASVYIDSDEESLPRVDARSRFRSSLRIFGGSRTREPAPPGLGDDNSDGECESDSESAAECLLFSIPVPLLLALLPMLGARSAAPLVLAARALARRMRDEDRALWNMALATTRNVECLATLVRRRGYDEALICTALFLGGGYVSAKRRAAARAAREEVLSWRSVRGGGTCLIAAVARGDLLLVDALLGAVDLFDDEAIFYADDFKIVTSPADDEASDAVDTRGGGGATGEGDGGGTWVVEAETVAVVRRDVHDRILPGLTRAAFVNLRDTPGCAALHYAARLTRTHDCARRDRLVSMLLSAGADPSAIDPKGNSPLHYAAFGAASLAVGSPHRTAHSAGELLIAAGADPSIRNNSGLTAADMYVQVERELRQQRWAI